MCLTVSGLSPFAAGHYGSSAKPSSEVLGLESSKCGDDYGAARLLKATAVSSHAFRPILLSSKLSLAGTL